MKYNLCTPPQIFQNARKKIEQKYKGAEKDIEKAIKEFCENPTSAHEIPGYGGQLAKVRAPIRKQNISKRQGLRLIFLKKGKKITPLFIYSKADYPGESQVLESIKIALRSVSDQGDT